MVRIETLIVTYTYILRIMSACAFFVSIAMPQSTAHAEEFALLVIGDSLTAGYGLESGSGFTDQLEDALDREGMNILVLNGGVSGDTTAGGLARLEWMLSDKPDAVILELGANDGLRGIKPDETLANLGAILDKLKRQEIPVLLAGMLAPPNMGNEYAEDFKNVFSSLAAAHDVVFYPFFLEGVAGKRELNQEDATHPNAKGVGVIVKRIMPFVQQLISKAGYKTP